MSSRAVIMRRDAPRSASIEVVETNEANNLGLTVEAHLPQGTLVSGEDQALSELEQRGFRVKLLPDTNILTIGSYRIDIEEAPPDIHDRLKVPKNLAKTWPHHLVQLSAPPNERWIRAIEERGVDVVEPVSAYGLFVVGAPADVEALGGLDFVTWTGPLQPAYRIASNLQGLTGRIEYVNVGVYPLDEAGAVRDGIEKAGGTIVNEWGPEGSYRPGYHIMVVRLEARKLAQVARLPAVRWLEFQSPKLTTDDERSTQIVAENLDAAAPPNTGPVVGYQGALTALGLSGAGVVVGICDTGVDSNNNVGMHPDLAGRLVFFVDTTDGTTPTDRKGHGTHVAGIAVGNAATGDTDPQGFLLGQGVAPGASFGSLNPIMTLGGPGTLPVATFTQQMVNNGAQVMNNSWQQAGMPAGYTANAALVDRLVRDPNSLSADLDYLVIVFSAGNAGPGPGTISPPKEAKNPIVVGCSLNFRPGEGDVDDLRGLWRESSRGPAGDGRILPTIVAPGTDIVSARSTVDSDSTTPGVQRPQDAYTDTGGTVHADHTQWSGTSMATPHVSGLCALLIEWWRNRTGGRNPSPALLKALLVNGAEDCAGGPDGAGGVLANIPNNNQGWGRVSLDNIVLQMPDSDRGPKIFSDQGYAFTADGQEHVIRVAPVDTTRQLRITLAWTDPPGAANANPALMNDLDLEVTELVTGNVYKGNVFANGFSTTGGAFDNLNNVECVYLPNPSGTYEVRVIAAALTGNALPPFDATPWQDFALVIDNAEVPSATPVSVVPVLDRSGSMVAFGYEAVTRTSSKQVVDLLGVDDTIGVVSVGSNGAVEFPPGPGPVIQTITGQPVRDAAKAEIDGMAFGGCTYMGDGILKGRDLLAPEAGSRALVMLSDGYDNKGCSPADPSRPSALDAVGMLPANMPVYTCAMGPASDQVLLEQVANATGGRYYYMPTIDDLFEIYNYIRGQVSRDSIIANESAAASSSRVGAFVDACATKATFTVAWADTKLRFVSRNPKGDEVQVRLRDPRGRLLHPNASHVRRIEGQGNVVFELQEPMPGQWFIEVTTAQETHVRYTAGAFVRSPLRLVTVIEPKQMVAGLPLKIAAQLFDDGRPLSGFRAKSSVIAPASAIDGLLKTHAAQLKTIRAAPTGGDRVPSDIGKLLALRNAMIRKGHQDIFAHSLTNVTLRTTTIGGLTNLGLAHLAVPGAALVEATGALADAAGLARSVAPAQPLAVVAAPGIAPAAAPTGVRILPTGPIVTGPVAPAQPDTSSHVAAGLFRATAQRGTYNVTVSVTGVSHLCRSRFARKEMVSVLVR